jgi:hypothetical protein
MSEDSDYEDVTERFVQVNPFDDRELEFYIPEKQGKYIIRGPEEFRFRKEIIEYMGTDCYVIIVEKKTKQKQLQEATQKMNIPVEALSQLLDIAKCESVERTGEHNFVKASKCSYCGCLGE